MKPDHSSDLVGRVATLLVLSVAACQPAHSAADAAHIDADSIVLERSVCYGSCPAYRLTLMPSGAVHFVTAAQGDTVQRADTIAPRNVAWLATEAHRSGFYSFPREITRDRSLCPLPATDHPTATVTIFRGDSTHSVIDYAGCYTARNLSVAPALAPLRRFEKAIDSVAGSKRWVELARPK